MRGGRAKTGVPERDAVNRTSSRQKIAARNIFLRSAGSILTCVRSHHPGVILLIFEDHHHGGFIMVSDESNTQCICITYTRTRGSKGLFVHTPFALFLACTLWLAVVSHASATALPDGFAEVQYAHGLTYPTAMAFAPDRCSASGTPVHRLFVCEQSGTVRVFRNGVLQPQPFLSVHTESCDERGLDGICFDPNFAANHYVYVYYTVFASADSSLPTHNRLSRFTADPVNPDVALPGSETPIMEMDTLNPFPACIHNGGAMHFGRDGKLYVAVGNNGVNAHSQDFGTVLGKILRINPVPENPDGTNPESTFPTDNPFYSTTTGKNRAIYILGLRNPFTFNFQVSTGRMFIDDVGEATCERIFEGIKGGNCGWPEVECPADSPIPGLINPIFAYEHNPNFTPHGCALTGGTFYNPPHLCAGDPPYGFPSSYVGKYFFLDLCAGWIYTLDPNQVDVTSSFQFPCPLCHTINLFAYGIHGTGSGDQGSVYLTQGPDANLYYISRVDRAVYQISYPGSLSPTVGTQPDNQLAGQGSPATFTVAASGVQPLHYQWQRGTTNIVGAPDSPNYTLEDAQVATDNQATFRCVVTNAYGSSTSQSAVLTVIPQQPPTANITSPAPNTNFRAGDVISFAGSATDPQDGTLPPSALTWTILLEDHAVSDSNHFSQPFFGPVSGIANGTVTIPTRGRTEPDIWYRIFLTATDSFGLTRTTFTDIVPELSRLSVVTNPAVFQSTNVRLKVRLDGLPKYGPYPFWSVVNLIRNIGVDTPQVLNGLTYDFYSWSDNGARFHDISAPLTSTTYVANFWKRPGYGSITANPNPVELLPGNTTGVTNVFWSSAQAVAVEVHRDSPSGPLFARTASGSFSLPTGNWVQEGTRLFLQDVTGGQSLTPAFTLDSVTLHVTAAPTGSITANPNPVIPDWRGKGATTLSWTSYGTSSVEIHVNAPNGPGFVSSGSGTFTAITGHWAGPGITFYLQNTSNSLPLTAANTLAKVTMVGGTISVNPDPIIVTDGSGLGVATITSTSTGTSAVEVHVNSPSGNLLYRTGPGTFSGVTGKWVRNGQKFYLQDASDGKPLTSANTLAVATAVVISQP
jgi:glucose/arabinose dehydrogenase